MILIKNIYHMLAYAFQVLSERGYADFSTEEFDNTQNLLSAILERGITYQIKRGLRNEYIPAAESTLAPRGKIDVASSIKSRCYINQRLCCEFDEYNADILLNQILKTTALLALKSQDVDSEIKRKLKKTLLYFNSIQTIDPTHIAWNKIHYSRNNSTYKMLVNICYLLINGLLQSGDDGTLKLADFFDDQKMHRLFEKFVLEYYKRHYSFLKPASLHIPWDTDDNVIEFLPAMKSDVVLKYDKKTLIIDTKYYSNTMQTGRFDRKSVHSNNLYQIFTYVKNQDTVASGLVSGLLLYAKTDEAITPNYSYQLGGNNIYVRTVDLNLSFNDIALQLNNIIAGWLPELPPVCSNRAET